MYSNKTLRYLIIAFIAIGLIPLVLLSLQTGNSEYDSLIYSVTLKSLGISILFATVLTLVILKISGLELEPLILTILGIIGLYLFSITIAGFFPVIGILVLVLLGWGLSSWLLELPILVGAYVGVSFYLAKFIGGLFAFANISTMAP